MVSDILALVWLVTGGILVAGAFLAESLDLNCLVHMGGLPFGWPSFPLHYGVHCPLPVTYPFS